MILAFNKPYSVLSQFTPEIEGQRTLAEFGFPKDVYPIGRLDRDSEGLLLLSNQRGLNHALLDPENGHRRSYLTQVEGIPTTTSIAKLSNGTIRLKQHRCRSCEVEILSSPPSLPERDPPIRVRRNIPTSWLRICLTEGKNRQVRRMTAAVGHPTLRLYRDSIVNYKLSGLNAGQWTQLEPDQINLLGIT